MADGFPTSSPVKLLLQLVGDDLGIKPEGVDDLEVGRLLRQ